MPVVALSACPDYRDGHVEAAILTAVDQLGGWNRFVRPGMRVFVKPNLVIRSAPDRSATTHPAVIEAVCKAIAAAGGIAIIGESAGGPYQPAWMNRVFAGCGMLEAAERSGAKINDDYSEQEVDIPNGSKVRHATMISAAFSADAIINVAKLKTHGFATYTGACKNLFGLIPGMQKMEYHARFPDIVDFAEMLVDLAESAAPVLNIIDGIVGMEGDGPSHGTPRTFGALIASPSPHAADLAGARIMGLDARRVPTLAAAQARGLIDGVSFVGEDVERFIQSDAIIPATPESSRMGLLKRVSRRFFRVSPRPVPKRCVGCGICKDICPKGCVDIREGKVHIRNRDCIRCLCCAELCPKHAIVSHPSILMRIIR